MKYLALSLLLSTVSYAIDTTSCETCHGYKGKSPTITSIPKIAGQNRAYLIKQLEDFKSGERKSPTMNTLTSGMSSQRIRELADYFSNNSCK